MVNAYSWSVDVGIDVCVVADFDVDNSLIDVVAVDADAVIVDVDIDVFTSMIQFKPNV